MAETELTRNLHRRDRTGGERQLRASGFPPRLAAEAAADERFDLHALIELTERGCPPDLAVRILAPLEPRCDERAGVYSLRVTWEPTHRSRAQAPELPASSIRRPREWLSSLRDEGPARDEAIERLHALLLRGARFEVGRRQASLPHLRGGELDDIALEAADDALMSVLRRLDDFRGLSRFTTWAYKFALLRGSREAAPARLAGARGADGAGGVGSRLERQPPARPGGRAGRAADGDPAAPSTRVLSPHQRRVLDRPCRQRRADRRSRRAPRHHARRALQDAARRPAQAAAAARRRRILRSARTLEASL